MTSVLKSSFTNQLCGSTLEHAPVVQTHGIPLFMLMTAEMFDKLL